MSASTTSGTYPRARATAPVRPGATLHHVWQFLLDLGAHRAHPELMRLSRRYAVSDPALSRQLATAAREVLQG